MNVDPFDCIGSFGSLSACQAGIGDALERFDDAFNSPTGRLFHSNGDGDSSAASTERRTAASVTDEEASSGARTEPRNLAEKLTLDEAKAGAGRRIMQGKVKDPAYPEDIWAKIQHVHQHPDGTQTVIHYWENLLTGLREGFKFK